MSQEQEPTVATWIEKKRSYCESCDTVKTNVRWWMFTGGLSIATNLLVELSQALVPECVSGHVLLVAEPILVLTRRAGAGFLLASDHALNRTCVTDEWY